MVPELPRWLLAAPPPANLADLLALRGQALYAPPPAHARAGAWERWRWGMQRVQACFAAHPCLGSGCAKCAEYYAVAQVLEARKRQLLEGEAATPSHRLGPWTPQGEV